MTRVHTNGQIQVPSPSGFGTSHSIGAEEDSTVKCDGVVNVFLLPIRAPDTFNGVLCLNSMDTSVKMHNTLGKKSYDIKAWYILFWY